MKSPAVILKLLLAIIYIVILAAFHANATAIVINEFMASNGITIADEDGDFEDWIELYNTSDEAVDIQGYYLSDKDSNPLRWRFPSTVIPPKGYLLVFASGKNRFSSELHTNFRIAASGEPLILSDPDGNQLDYIPPQEPGRDYSFGRFPDGGDSLMVFTRPSPGSTNMPPYDTRIEFSLPSGFYHDTLELQLETDQSDVRIYYTTNGNVPDTNSLIFDHSLLLLPSKDLPTNPIVGIPTNVTDHSRWYQWKPPGADLFHANVIRARAFREGIPCSDIVTATYIIDSENEDRFILPVISVVADESSLFGHEKGLFVPGKTFEDAQHPGSPWTTGNFVNRGKAWERTVDFFYMDVVNDSIWSQRMGMRIHGGGSRSFPQKSLRMYAREIYGKDEIHFSFFNNPPNKFSRLLLRNSGQDFLRTMFADGLTHLLIAETGLAHQRYRPAVLFVNGAYWGIINIRDRIDKYYLEDHFGVQSDQLDLLEFGGFDVIEGSREDYLKMMDFIRSNSLEDSQNYDSLGHWMDIQNFIDYYIAKMYIATYDWPGNNIKFWRDRSGDSKWRWVYFDNDDALRDLEFDPYDHLTDSMDNPWPNPLWSTELFRNLILNENFRGDFFDRIQHHLATTFEPERTLEMAQITADRIRDEIPHHINRWGYPESMAVWESHVEEIIDFLSKRPCVFLKMSSDFFQEDVDDELFGHCFSNSNELAKRNSISVYPNPVSDQLTVEFSEGFQAVNIEIFDLSGKLILTEKQTHDRSPKAVIETRGLSPGAYLLRITGNDWVPQTTLIVVQ